MWQNCEPYNLSSFGLFKNDGSTFDPAKQCYKIKQNENFALEQKDCKEKNGAVCEQYIEGI
jgi:hypothetical protein